MRHPEPVRLAPEGHYALSYAPDAGLGTDGSDSENRGVRQALVNQYKNQETA